MGGQKDFAPVKTKVEVEEGDIPLSTGPLSLKQLNLIFEFITDGIVVCRSQ